MTKSPSAAISSTLLAVVCAIAPISPASARLSANSPVKIAVGLAPGGAADVGTRMLANAYGDQFGRQAVVENRPGGGDAAAALAVKAAPEQVANRMREEIEVIGTIMKDIVSKSN